MHTKQGFPLVPAPSYLPNMYELGHSDVRQIDDRASTEIRRVENEMLVIMQEHQEREQQDVSHNSFHSSFSRIRSEELNDMGCCLSRISPITFNDDAFQMPNNRAKDRAPTLTPRKRKNDANDRPTTQTPHHDGNNKSHNANIGSNEPTSRFVPSQPHNTSSSSQGTDSSNTPMVYYEKSNGEHQGKCASIQMSPRNTVSTGAANTTQTTNQKAFQVDGTQTTPPSSLREPTSTGETQMSPPPKDEPCRQLGQDQLDRNQERQPTSATTSQGKKTKDSTTEAPPCPGPSAGPSAGPRNDFSGYWQTYNLVYSMW